MPCLGQAAIASLAILRGHANTVGRVLWSGDGERVISGSGDKTIRFGDPRTREEIAVVRSGPSSTVSSRALTAGAWRSPAPTAQSA